MSEIKFVNVSKVYKVANGHDKYALKNVNLTIDKGLICILGKSGSGKSTMLNMIGLLDFPSSGEVYINGKCTNKMKEKAQNRYRASTCGFIFQHYHLLENQSALTNVMLPALISGENKAKAKKKAIKLLNEFGLDEIKGNKNVAKYSGGEKERVAIARSMINDPDILLADEPTGALDSTNSESVMKVLKDLSKNRIVIMVTHNNEIAEEYADRIIKIEDGNITEIIEKTEKIPEPDNNKKKHFSFADHWSNSIIVSNLMRRSKRNLISTISLIICIVATLLILGFSYGSGPSIDRESLKQFDLGAGSISKETTEKIDKSSISLIKTTRPNEADIEFLRKENADFIFGLSYETLLANYNFYLGDESLNELAFTKIYSFKNSGVDSSLLVKGKMPNDSLEEVVINESAYKYIQDKFKYDPLDSIIEFKTANEFTYYTGEETKPYINDIFVLEKKFRIKGVVKELNFLSSPKVFYPYVALEEYMENTLLNNLSSYFERDISWYERVKESSNSDPLSSYAYEVFLKNIKNPDLLRNNKLEIDDTKYTNLSLVLGDTLKDLISASCVGMELFLIIAVVGSALILGILSLSSYSEDRKNCAILSCLGATKNQIEDIYLSENILLGIVSLIFSFLITALVTSPINNLIKGFFGMSEMVKIPYLSFFGIPYGLPLLIVVSIILLITMATLIPIKLSKKISLKEELADE